jgi:hypothetical protein
MSRSVTSDHFRINYKMNHSTQSTKAELKSSAIRISTAQGKANAMQRGSSASIKTFYHQIASTNQVFRLKPDQTPTQQRPVSQYGSIKPREFKLNSKFDQSSTSEIKSSSNLRLVNSQLNEHFGKHFGRNYRSLKRIKQHPSVDCHQKIPSTDLVGYSQKKEPKITVTSSKSRLADNLSNEIKSEEESEHSSVHG